MNQYNPFYDEVKERNAIKNGAFHKKNGSKSKKCTLPSDNLTPAQKRRLNGPVKEYALHEPMSWEDFKAMPTDLQQAHLDYIQLRFRVSATVIGQEVFGLSPAGLRLYMANHGLGLASYKGKPAGAATLEAIRNWLAGDTHTPDAGEAAEPEAPVLVEQEAPIVPAVAPETEEPREKFAVRKLSAILSGSADDLLTYISAMLAGRNAELELTLTFKNEGEKNIEN